MATPWIRLGSRIASITEREQQRFPVDRDHPGPRLKELQAFQVAVQTEIDEQVIEARGRGWTWADLGAVLGMSKQGAQHRWRIAMERSGRATYTGSYSRSMGEFSPKSADPGVKSG